MIGPRSTSLFHRLNQFDLIPGIVGDRLTDFRPGSRQRIVYIVNDREIAVIGAPRIVAVVEGQRTVAITGNATRTVTIDPMVRTVAITADREEDL